MFSSLKRFGMLRKYREVSVQEPQEAVYVRQLAVKSQDRQLFKPTGVGPLARTEVELHGKRNVDGPTDDDDESVRLSFCVV
uniref:Uncharacterized protein n=1 Tax=Plectus sambesii TaxID=2011161 RepID=A0A914VAU8_9BILA